jgi:hypothetical protein
MALRAYMPTKRLLEAAMDLYVVSSMFETERPSTLVAGSRRHQQRKDLKPRDRVVQTASTRANLRISGSINIPFEVTILSTSHPKRACLKLAFLLSLVALLGQICGPFATAQLSSASVSGAVKDPSGAVVQGTRIELKNTGTGVDRIAISNDSGSYNFPAVPPGPYALTAAKDGFNTFSSGGFTLVVSQTSTIDITMTVGAVAQSVSVQAEGEELETGSSQLGTVIGSKEVTDLPLNGRNFTQLLSLTPGASPISVAQNGSGDRTPTTFGSSFTFPAVNGQTNRSNFFMVDGLNDENSWYNTYTVPPIIDAIQEFKVLSHPDQAQYGGVTGGIVNVVTKSGTQYFHGSAWEYLRNDFFDARNPFLTSVTPLRQNQFGGSLGGPVILPKLAGLRNNTFFFIAAEGFLFSQPSNNFFIVPTAAELNGDLSAVPTQIYDPSSTRPDPAHPGQFLRTPYTNNQITPGQIDQGAVAYAKLVLPAPIFIPSTPQYNAINTESNKQQQQNYTVRIDHNFGDHDFLWFRYSAVRLNETTPGGLPSITQTLSEPGQNYGASWVHVFGPSLSLQAQIARSHLGYDSESRFTVPNVIGTYGATPAIAGFVGGTQLMPQLGVNGFFGGGESSAPSPDLSSTWQYKSDVTKSLGRHVIQFGGEWNSIGHTEKQLYGQVGFAPQQTADPNNLGNTGSALASFLLNVPDNAYRRNVNIAERPGGVLGLYVQDQLRVTQNLTVNVGLRYDRTFIPGYGTESSVGTQGSIETGDMDFGNGTYIVQQLPPSCEVRGHAPCVPGGVLPDHVVVSSNKRILHDTRTNFGPRIGAIYRVDPRTVVHVGFGIIFDNWAAAIQLAQNYQGSWPDIGTQSVQNLNLPSGASALPTVTGQNPFLGAGASDLPAATPFTPSNANYYVDPNIRNPYSEQYNFGIEQQLTPNMNLSINYVGSESHRLDVGTYYNTAVTPGPGDPRARSLYPYMIASNYDRSIGNGTYNSLQVALSRRLENGLAYQVSYTWSKSIDEGSSGYFGVEGTNVQNPYNIRGDRSVSAFDLPQQFTANVNYEVPVGRGKRFSTGNRVADFVLGGWQGNAIFSAHSGQNFSLYLDPDIANIGNEGYERPNLVGNPKPTQQSKEEWFNTAAFVTPAQYTYGNVERNSLRQQAFWNLDFSLFRQFPLYEAARLELRGEAFNATNSVIYGAPGTDLSSPTTFGVVSSTANDARKLQIAAKIIF